MRTMLVTGANKDLGRQLAEHGEEVIATCRRSSLELDALRIKVFQGVEMTDDESCGRFVHRNGQVLPW
jgi:NAD(P)-dependent dehydrogenase (short-subunit alcohol dehydrogenase family)